MSLCYHLSANMLLSTLFKECWLTELVRGSLHVHDWSYGFSFFFSCLCRCSPATTVVVPLFLVSLDFSYLFNLLAIPLALSIKN